MAADLVTTGVVTPSNVGDMLDYFARNLYRARDADPQVELIEDKCLQLFGEDYAYSVVNNANGELCNNYPRQLVILEYEKYSADTNNHQRHQHDLYESVYDAGRLREQFMKARFARCRARFPLPVILFDGKHICRSSTLSGGPEIYGRSGYDLLFSGGESIADVSDDEDGDDDPVAGSDWQLFDRVRNQDIKLLRMLSIRHICDLMVEKKKVKFGVNVTSSEKVDKEKRYADFTLVSLPYPGCEFFRVYRDCGYNAEGLIFDWNQSHIDTSIEVPNDATAAQLNVDWVMYRSWDLVHLTQNYFRLVLRYLVEGPSGILIHCISGWDRTPLFISLLRVSLWADGKIHQSLGPNEILYLTLAYDWFLCGHNLADRLNKGEEILFFCFYFLKHIMTEEFSVSKKQRSCNHRNRTTVDGVMDGVLLEEERRNSVCGSNTSLSSNCSSLSCRSQENPPPLFTNADSDSADLVATYNGNQWRPVSDSPSSSGLQSAYSSTTPVAVPTKVRRRSDSGSSASCGSWQIITGTGSVRGSASTSDTCHTSSSDTSTHSKLSLCDIQESEGSLASSTATVVPASRRERLQSVRSCFYSQYCASVGFHNKTGAEASRLSSLFDQFAEKVGIRSTVAVNRLT